MEISKVKTLIAGALYDMMGYLTSRPEVLTLSGSHDAAPAAEVLKKFLARNGLFGVEPNIYDWTKTLDDHSNVKWPSSLTCSMDASVWADEFVKLNPEADEGTMIAWFANAIMAGYDEAERRQEAHVTKIGNQLANELCIAALKLADDNVESQGYYNGLKCAFSIIAGVDYELLGNQEALSGDEADRAHQAMVNDRIEELNESYALAHAAVAEDITAFQELLGLERERVKAEDQQFQDCIDQVSADRQLPSIKFIVSN